TARQVDDAFRSEAEGVRAVARVVPVVIGGRQGACARSDGTELTEIQEACERRWYGAVDMDVDVPPEAHLVQHILQFAGGLDGLGLGSGRAAAPAHRADARCRRVDDYDQVGGVVGPDEEEGRIAA